MHSLSTLATVLLTMTLAGSLPAQDDPKATSGAVVESGKARFTVLTRALVRMEYAPDGKFEDRATLAFINRKLPVPEMSATKSAGWLIIETDDLLLRYKEKSGDFAAENLTIELKHLVGGERIVWHPGMADEGNLRGTTRTLDGVSGSTTLEPGLVSKKGWALVDDSARVLFDDSEWPWAVERTKRDTNRDWYFFGHGRDYIRALQDFTKVSGRIPLPPRYVFGTWWSRYWPYKDSEFKEIVADFRKNDVPLDVLVIDMDWHLPGWTGYTFDPKYFPDPAGFFKWLHAEGLRTTLNLHPADGVKEHEAAYADVAKAMGVDPATKATIPFSAVNRKYVDAYFKYLHHPLEKIGVDFWWMDWQQQKTTELAGLDPLFWLNYTHWTDMERNPDRAGLRPLIFSRWGGLGNHRYQIGFSGDTFNNWESLAFQPYFTATAGNVGYGYWSHDIGGHQPGIVAPELYARWIQWAAFNPILRTHATANPLAERRIWKFPETVFHAAREAFHLRYELIPYIYTAARNTYDTAIPLCSPLYYHWPNLSESYERRNQYMFGSDLMVAPVVQPADPSTGCALVKIWLPPGEWIDWFSGTRYMGQQEISRIVPLDEIPVFVREGAIIPGAPKMRSSSERPLDPLVLNVWPTLRMSGQLYEDDGVGSGYEKGEFTRTRFEGTTGLDGKLRLTIQPTEGSFEGMLKSRRYAIRLHDSVKPVGVSVDGVAIDSSAILYDASSLTAELIIPAQSVASGCKIEIEFPEAYRQDALRSGLRGRAKSVRDVAGILGGQTPKIVEQYLYLAEQAGEGADQLNALVDASEGEAWQSLVAGVGEGTLTPERQMALLRLLGFSSSMNVTVAKERMVTLSAEFDSLERASGLGGEVSLNLPPGWGQMGKRFTAMSINEFPTKVSWDLVPPKGTFRTDELGMTLDLTRGQSRFTIPMSKVVFPSINDWWIVGPFDNPWEKGLDQVNPPETSLDLSESYVGKGGEVIRWKHVQRSLEPGADIGEEMKVDFHKEFGKPIEFATAYALTDVTVDKATEAQIALGSDDGVAIWVNGTQVWKHAVGRPYNPRQDVVPISLKAGRNQILLKISQGDGGWLFCAHLENRDGTPLKAE